ncbi:hypothetical protein ACF0H5_014132 [Mactra antiquata]
MTLQYYVGYVDSHIVGNISWNMYNDTNYSTILLRLKLFLNENLNDVKYYMMDNVHHHYGNKSDSYTTVVFPCIVIPLSPNISLKTELFLLNTRSCDCGMMGENHRSQLCLDQCEISMLYEEVFHLSLDACHIYDQYIDYNLSSPVDVQSRVLSNNTTIFSAFLININPFTHIRVWIFSSDDDDDYNDYSPVVTWETWSNPSGEIYFEDKEVNHSVNTFYLMFITYCSPSDYEVYYTDDMEYDNYDVPDLLTVNPVKDQIYKLINQKQQQPGWIVGLRNKPVIAIIIVLSMVFVVGAVVVFLWWRVKHCKVITCSIKSNNHVLQDNEKMNSEKLLGSIHKVPDLNNRHILKDFKNLKTSSEDIQEAILIHHAFTPTWQTIIEDFENFLAKNNIFVENFQSDLTVNWFDYAEQAGTVYPNVIFILSSELLQLLKIYKTKEPKGQKLEERNKNKEDWNKLMIDRHWNLIPCVVLNKLRILYYDKIECFRVHLITFSDENNQSSSEILHNQFLEMFCCFLNTDNTICYNINTSDLKKSSPKNSDLNILVKLLTISRPIQINT